MKKKNRKNLLFHSFSHLSKSLVLILFFLACWPNEKTVVDYFKIQVIDQVTGEGIPMVELMGLNNQKYYTDSQGYIAFNESGMMNQPLYFYISSEGYWHPKDQHGKAAVQLIPTLGGEAILKMKRKNLAERLYRSTGAGIYNHSEKLGLPLPIKKPQLNAGVIGQDSNLSTKYKGKIFWIWGDTFLPEDYQGNFSVAGATSELPLNTNLHHSIGIDYQYFINEKGQSKNMIAPQGEGYIWFDWLMNVPTDNGEESLVAKFARVNAYFGNYERGIAIYNDEKEIFERYKNMDSWLEETHSCSHPFLAQSEGKQHFYLFNETGLRRVEPKLESISDASAYEFFSCLTDVKIGTGSANENSKDEVERNAQKQVVYNWRKNTSSINYENQKQLIAKEKLKPSEALFATYDIQSGEPLEISRGSIFWNNYRQRWVMIMGKKDIHYLEADTPVGPWAYGQRVASHEILFYNPLQHPFFDEEDGRMIYFEGTYTQFFGQGKLVPLYNYNQLMYRLDLSAVHNPVAVYEFINDATKVEYGFRQMIIKNDQWKNIQTIPFYALEKKGNRKGLIPIYKTIENGKNRLSTTPNGSPLFYGISNETQLDDYFIGSWECKFNFPSFDNFSVIHISQKGEKINVETDNASFHLAKAAIENSQLKMTLQHHEKEYQLTATIENGVLEGQIKNPKTAGTATWTGEKIDADWWGQHSANVIALYEYQHRLKGDYYYSTDAKLSSANYKRTAQALCKVWKNPHSILMADFEIEPIGL